MRDRRPARGAGGRSRRDLRARAERHAGLLERRRADRARCCATAGCTPAISAHRDADGYLYIDGRAVEMIKVGAFRVSPQEIEEVIAPLPGVRGSGGHRASPTKCSARRSRPSSCRAPAPRSTCVAVKAHCRAAPRRLQGSEGRGVRGDAAAHVFGQESNASNWLERNRRWQSSKALDATRSRNGQRPGHRADLRTPARDPLQGRRRAAASSCAMSGGIDSSVSSALCVKALGPERVYGIMLPERDSSGFSTARGQPARRAPRASATRCSTSRRRSKASAATGSATTRSASVFPEYGDGWKNKIVISGGLEGRINHFELVVQTPAGRAQDRAPAAAASTCRSSPRPTTSSASARPSSTSTRIA